MSSTPPVPRTWTTRDLLAWARDWFSQRDVDAPRLTAELLLSHVLGVARIKLYTDLDRPLEKPELAAFKELVKRRAGGEPVQYVVGSTEFYGRPFKADKRALIPRPETELVAERVLRHLPKDFDGTVADVACGSGTLGLTIAAERPKCRVVLTDVSADALALCRENAANLGLSERVELREGDLCAPLGDDVFTAVVANLPYVAETDRPKLARHILDHEPGLALFSGTDGLDHLRRFVPAVARHLGPGGLVVVEHGEEQGASVPALFDASTWEKVTLEKDLAKLDRFTWALRKA